MSEAKITRSDGYQKALFSGADKDLLFDLAGRNAAWIEPSSGSGVTAVTLYKRSAASTGGDVWATTGITISVTAGQLTRLPDLGDGYGWGRCKLVATAPSNPASTEWVAVHFSS